jgi:hypothetical protein
VSSQHSLGAYMSEGMQLSYLLHGGEYSREAVAQGVSRISVVLPVGRHECSRNDKLGGW